MQDNFIVYLLLGYIIGSINISILISRYYRLSDPRMKGSKNPGATNMYRVHGKKIGLFTLCLDFCKGFFPLWGVAQTGMNEEQISVILALLCIGHCYPIFFKFQGGRGVATVLGGIFYLDFFVGLFILGGWGGYFMLARHVGVSVILTSLTLLCYELFLIEQTNYSIMFVIFLILWRHRQYFPMLIFLNKS